jgi:hypothetical protein
MQQVDEIARRCCYDTGTIDTGASDQLVSA